MSSHSYPIISLIKKGGHGYLVADLCVYIFIIRQHNNTYLQFLLERSSNIINRRNNMAMTTSVITHSIYGLQVQKKSISWRLWAVYDIGYRLAVSFKRLLPLVAKDFTLILTTERPLLYNWILPILRKTPNKQSITSGCALLVC